MENEKDRTVRAARTASGLTQENAALILGMSNPTYSAREKLPKAFTIDELEDLFNSFNESGRKIIQDFISEIFLLK